MEMDVIAELEKMGMGESSLPIMQQMGLAAHQMEVLKGEMEEAQKKFDEAKNAYDTYRCVTLPNILSMHGIREIMLDSGMVVKVDKMFYCSPNKNDMDRNLMAGWLRENGGGSLVKEDIVIGNVDDAVKRLLEENLIPYSQTLSMNTNSIKAFLKDLRGYKKGSVERVGIDDIPSCFHFVERDECVIKEVEGGI